MEFPLHHLQYSTTNMIKHAWELKKNIVRMNQTQATWIQMN
jgi:hypothetical protein